MNNDKLKDTKKLLEEDLKIASNEKELNDLKKQNKVKAEVSK